MTTNFLQALKFISDRFVLQTFFTTFFQTVLCTRTKNHFCEVISGITSPGLRNPAELWTVSLQKRRNQQGLSGTRPTNGGVSPTNQTRVGQQAVGVVLLQAA